jgi:hypothetical protein
MKNGKVEGVEKFEKIAKTDISAIEKIACEFPLHAQSILESALAMTMKDGDLWLFEYIDPSRNVISQVHYEGLMSEDHKKKIKEAIKMIDESLILLREKYPIKNMKPGK